jgi:thymidylate synthase
MSLKPITIEATTLSDAWFQTLFKCIEVGRDFQIDQGSFEGQKRLEFDFVTIHIKHPSVEPLLPKVNPALGFPDPVEEGYLDEYLPYLMTGELKDGESYTYGQRLNKCKLSESVYNDLNLPNNLIYKDIKYLNLGHTAARQCGGCKEVKYDYFFNQVEHMITTYKEKGHRNNQMILQVAQPDDMMLLDPPCLRHIDTRIQDGKLHFFPYFRSWDLFCLDDESEILTLKGWKNKETLKLTDQVAALNEETNEIEYVPVENKLVRPYTGKMHVLKNKRVDQLVTPEHKIIHKYVTHSGSKRIIKDTTYTEAKNLIPKDGSRIPLTGVCNYTTWDLGVEEAALIGWVLTDAHYKAECDRIEIYQSEKKYTLEIRKLLTALHIPWTEQSRERVHYQICEKSYPEGFKSQCTVFGIPAAYTRWIKMLIPDRMPTHKLLFLPFKEREALFNAMIQADGSFKHKDTENTTCCFYSQNRHKREWFQLLAFSLGYRTTINERKGCVNCSNSRTYSTLQRDCFAGTSLPTVDYAGDVWCIQTKHKNFVMRRNNKISITGNSGFPANLGAIELMKQYCAEMIGVENGEIIATSKGLHIYEYVFEIAETIRGRSIEEFRKEALALFPVKE